MEVAIGEYDYDLKKLSSISTNFKTAESAKTNANAKGKAFVILNCNLCNGRPIIIIFFHLKKKL